jgi:ribosome-interacting GTPase 1
VWYLEQRLKYLVEPKLLANKLIIKIRAKDISFKNLIRNYANDILIERDNILNSLKFDINDIINDNLSDENLEKIKENFYSPAEIINIYMNEERNKTRFIERLCNNEHV